MENLSRCPACGTSNAEFWKKIKDHSVSGKVFSLEKCVQCGLIYTNPRPSALEIGPYYESSEYISHTNSSKGLFNKVYQTVRNYAIRQKIKLIHSFNKESFLKILDIGCGTGEFLDACQKKGWICQGIEPNPKARTTAISNHKLNVLPEEGLNNLNEKFDVITMWHVLEHVHDLKGRIRTLINLIKPGSVLIIAVPNPASKDAQIYQEYWAAYDVPRHLYHFTPYVLKSLLQSEGMKHIKSFPMKFDSFYVSLLSQKYKTGGKSGVIKAILNGLKSNFSAGSDPEKYSSVIYVFEKS